jgi:hypothetical protein
VLGIYIRPKKMQQNSVACGGDTRDAESQKHQDSVAYALGDRRALTKSVKKR